MSTWHSSVNYVEPNDINAFEVDGNRYSKIPSLENYCISMNIEAEVTNRSESYSEGTGKSVIVLSWNSTKDNKSSVNFMSGTRIMRDDLTQPQFLTTDPYDMYTDDIINHGTSEMVGIKSVNVEYAMNCVPVITVQMTDVRGFSLFLPEELSKDKTHDGIGGIDESNVARSFFHCFFMLPYPKFRIYLKGFYGRPVAYEVMCDKFNTNFNSSTGSFDVTVRFIGYTFSFLTDISLSALIGAPYSTYLGAKYWKEQIDNGRFQIYDSNNASKVPMPTMYEMKKYFRNVINESDTTNFQTTDQAEETTHSEEIKTLSNLKYLYTSWYAAIEVELGKKFGKDRVIGIMSPNDENLYLKLVILTDSSSPSTLESIYNEMQSGGSVKKVTSDLYAAIESYNKKYSGSLKNISKDFKDYVKYQFLNKFTKTEGGGIKYNGVMANSPISDAEATSRVLSDDSGNKVESRYKAIYNDGTNQYTSCYLIAEDYSSISERIKTLQADANGAVVNSESPTVYSKRMIDSLHYYPSLENFSKIMMAHLETLMYCMYNLMDDCKGRTAAQLGVKVGSKGGCVDVKEDEEIIPPFPKMTQDKRGDDGIVRREDDWVGNYNNGIGFREVDMVNGLFNGIEKVMELDRIDEQLLQEQAFRNETESGERGSVKYPLTPFDVYLDKNPYGDDNGATVNDYDTLIKKIYLRMFAVLCLSSFRAKTQSIVSDSNVLSGFGATEAENFFELNKLTNENVRSMLLGSDKESDETVIGRVSQEIIDKLKGLEYVDGKFFPKQFMKGNTLFVPLQDISLSGKIKDDYEFFTQKRGNNYTNDNFVNLTHSNGLYKNVVDGGNVWRNYIYIEDNYTKVYDAMSYSYKNICTEYNDTVKNVLYPLCTPSSGFNETIKSSGVTSFCPRKLTSDDKTTTINEIKGDAPLYVTNSEKKQVTYAMSSEALINITSDVANKRFNGFTITEVFGWKHGNGGYSIDHTKDLFVMDFPEKYGEYGKFAFFVMGVDCLDYEKMLKTLIGTFNSGNDPTASGFNGVTPISFIPKVAALQIGAALYFDYYLCNSSEKEKACDSIVAADSLRKYIPLPNGFEGHLIDYINTLGRVERAIYVKYFKDWADKNKKLLETFKIKTKNRGEIKNGKNTKKQNEIYRCYYFNEKELKRALLRETHPDVISLTDDLMLPVAVIKMNVFCNKHNLYGEGLDKYKENYGIDEGKVKTYLGGFIKKLRALCLVGYKINESGQAVKLTDSPNQTTEAMKIELYRYLKQVHDKWLPMSKFDEWKYETFFKEDDDSSSEGHTFHFIDSFYNKVGSKIIVNPSDYVHYFDVAIGYNDINVQMLGFMSDIYASTKCMFMCIQNFKDLTNKESMESTFVPYAYNEMPAPRKHPDFVVVYPYEPSKNLNIEGSQYNDDGFLLNDVLYTPMAITSRDESDNSKFYNIPAFGVSYGRQYQSYFKDVNVGMEGAVQTQQAILAKHQIITSAYSSDKNAKGTKAQDLFDIYASQSYTCNVTMMGCAWIQPLMYMVLLNIPMFKGSYMIMKVTHSITPGNMETKITGCRMANTSNQIVEDIFLPQNGGSNSPEEMERRRHQAADVSNDCPYEVFPLFGSGGVDFSSELNRKVTRQDCGSDSDYSYCSGNTIGEMLTKIARQEGGNVSGDLLIQTMLIVTTMYNRRYSSKGYSKTIFNYPQYDIRNASTHSYASISQDIKDIVKNIFTQSPSWVLTRATQTKCTNSTILSKFPNKTTINMDVLTSIYQFGNYQEMLSGSNPGVTKNVLKVIQNASSDGTYGHGFYALPNKSYDWDKATNTNDKKDKDVAKTLFDAIQRSVESTQNCNVKLKYEKSGNYIIIKQADGKNEKLPKVFDIALNGYYNHIQEIEWVMDGQNATSKPSAIKILPSESVDVSKKKRTVTVSDSSGNGSYKFTNEGHDAAKSKGSEYINSEFAMSIVKKYGNLEGNKTAASELPQFTNGSQFQSKVFEDAKVTSCDSVVQPQQNGGYSSSEQRSGYWGGDVSNLTTGYIGDWNVGEAIRYLVSHAHASTKHNCSLYVEMAIAAGGGALRQKIATSECSRRLACAANGRSAGTDYQGAYKLRYCKDSEGKSILERHGFVAVGGGMTHDGNGKRVSIPFPLQAGDVAVIGYDLGDPNQCHITKKNHICMYSGSAWYSDFKQNDMDVYTSNNPYMIYRYKGGKITERPT